MVDDESLDEEELEELEITPEEDLGDNTAEANQGKDTIDKARVKQEVAFLENFIENAKNIQFLLISDGDTSILDSLKGKVKVLVQRCLWHIPYQTKYVVWQDGGRAQGERMAAGDVGAYGDLCDTAIG